MSAATVHELHPSDTTPRDTYTSTEVRALTGATYRQLDYWVRAGLIPGPKYTGSGNPREWTWPEVYVIAVMVHLVTAGFMVSVASRIAREHSDTGQAVFNLTDAITLAVLSDRDAR